MKKFKLPIYCLFFALLIICPGCNNQHTESIIIGRILPLTGPAASYGQSEQKGTILALEEINRNGGLEGRNLEILFEDTQCEVRNGVNAMKKLVDVHKVPAVLGATVSGITLAISPIANENKVLLLSPLSSLASITYAGPFVFRVMPSDAFQSRILAQWILESGYKKVAMLSINNAWGKGVSDGFRESYTNLGGLIIVSETCNVGDRDFKSQLNKISVKNPEALFCPTMPKEGSIILKQMKELSLNLPVFAGDSWSAPELLQNDASVANGVKYTYPAKYEGKEYQAFSNKFIKRFHIEPDVNAAGAYDAVNILSSCVREILKEDLPVTGDEIRKKMERVRDFRGATGITTFDRNGDPIEKKFDKMVIINGERKKHKDSKTN